MPQAITCAITRASARIRTATITRCASPRGKELDKAGLLVDFRELREVMKPVIDRLDHQMINDLEPFKLFNPRRKTWPSIFTMRPTSSWIVDDGRVRVKNVTIWETDKTTATYSEPRGSVLRPSRPQRAGETPAHKNHAGYRNLQIDTGGVLLRGAALHLCRLTGCNLRCDWCDSEYTFAGGSQDAMK